MFYSVSNSFYISESFSKILECLGESFDPVPESSSSIVIFIIFAVVSVDLSSFVQIRLSPNSCWWSFYLYKKIEGSTLEHILACKSWCDISILQNNIPVPEIISTDSFSRSCTWSTKLSWWVNGSQFPKKLGWIVVGTTIFAWRSKQFWERVILKSK